ncbi:MAG: hypothetical protein IGS48_24955 [Oscillatoriales cyanobacterium C42_A2020_001]|nr:hypothetical protein [Leptolyngbyaceae cyanobacterium C42_A2020_001]
MAANWQDFQPIWRGELSEYVTAIAWLPNGKSLVAGSAAGEVMLLPTGTKEAIALQTATGQSIDCLAVSGDGRFVAAGGQDGTVKIWQINSPAPELITTLENKPAWVDHMAWSPTANHLAFSLGRYGQVWEADANAIATTLNFESSSVLGLDWHPDGKFLALCGHQGARVWHIDDWDDDPQWLEIPSASVAIAWSTDGRYLANGNLDGTLMMVEWQLPENPWVMRGFPGKVRQLAWSQPMTAIGSPLLASCSAESVVVWERDADESIGWASQVLEAHEGTVQAIAFQPDTLLLASAAEDGWVCLWHNAQQLVQVLDGAPNGFSCLSWHPHGQLLAAGGQNGELLMWSQSAAGKGFSKH